MLSYDKITILNRSFNFNDMQAFTSAMETNLQSLTLNSTGLSARSWNLLSQGLKKCLHLHLLVKSLAKIHMRFLCLTYLNRIYRTTKSIKLILRN